MHNSITFCIVNNKVGVLWLKKVSYGTIFSSVSVMCGNMADDNSWLIVLSHGKLEDFLCTEASFH